MQIIPVIDLKGGTVVHARLGRRDLYRPIKTPLSPTSDPVDVVRGFLALYPFTSLYVADLDAIARDGDNRAAIALVKAAFPHLVMWVDSGVADLEAAAEALRQQADCLVIGSEGLRDLSVLARYRDEPRVVLSLDFRNAEFLGPTALLEDPDCWPQRIIVMTLARVGSEGGPDLGRLHAIKVIAGDRQLYAAGGARHAADLRALAQAGIAGVLVATALHSETLTAAVLRRL
jgi:phosphoribosylformimino-5-aminoimidazole carboxamide ribotide isomerase